MAPGTLSMVQILLYFGPLRSEDIFSEVREFDWLSLIFLIITFIHLDQSLSQMPL